MHSSRSQRSDQRSNKAASLLTTWAMTHLFRRGEMISFSEWWEAEEVFMRAEGADDEIILGAMRSIASTAWNDAIDAASGLLKGRIDAARGAKKLAAGSTREFEEKVVLESISQQMEAVLKEIGRASCRESVEER